MIGTCTRCKKPYLIADNLENALDMCDNCINYVLQCVKLAAWVIAVIVILGVLR
jgi:hypothetical protein